MDQPVKVWLGGEGPSEIGDRDRLGGERVGAVEALLRKVEPDGWRVAGAVRWKRIRKFTVGAARGRASHGDIHSIAGLVNIAYEAECEVVAFTRDVNAHTERAEAIRRGIALAREIRHLAEVEVIGGPAISALEGWILALLGVRDSESMSRRRAKERLADWDLVGKKAEDYVEVIEKADIRKDRLPPGCDGLCAWLATARDVLGRVMRRGDPVPPGP